ncbi:cell envelope biogenesis protein LolA [Longibacter salinarum]|uniref:Cell envelope biogenesis protein LolA n=1 Tax=Longibacter salinarum TaxID=1850348 RepID=A0A2A8D2R3_9BACT|nr:outer membrane lipoprotein carrier protein LolA [Longibacter salinarum]PEN15229.1 cell envelope biogenesis protein LolA [Longibacter salinarum]
MVTYFRSLLSGLLVLFVAVLPVQAQTDSTLLQEVQTRYESIDGIKAQFVQTIESEFSSTRRTEGTLYLAGSKYRVETPQQTFVTDGGTTWIYSPSQKQVVVNTPSGDGSDLTPETFFTNYAARYSVETSRDTSANGISYKVLDLKPTDPAASFDDVILWVNPSNLVIERLRVRDANKNVITIRLDDIEVNPGLSETTFQFDPPEDVEVVDLRSS